VLVITTPAAGYGPPAVVRPPASVVRGFLLQLATSRGKNNDCVRGYHFAVDVMGSNAVIYHHRGPAPGAGPAEMFCAVTPFHEDFALLTLNALVILIYC